MFQSLIFDKTMMKDSLKRMEVDLNKARARGSLLSSVQSSQHRSLLRCRWARFPSVKFSRATRRCQRSSSRSRRRRYLVVVGIDVCRFVLTSHPSGVPSQARRPVDALLRLHRCASCVVVSCVMSAPRCTPDAGAARLWHCRAAADRQRRERRQETGPPPFCHSFPLVLFELWLIFFGRSVCSRR